MATVQLDGTPAPVELTRCIAEPGRLLCPEEAKPVLEDIGNLIRSGGVVLTRRDILRFVTAEAGKRADEIQELLNLRAVDEIRNSLYRARTELRRTEKSALNAIETARAEVNVTLGEPRYSDESLVKMVNECRMTLGGEPLREHKSAAFKEGLAPPAVREEPPSSASSSLFQRVVQNIRQGIKQDLIPEYRRHDDNLRRSITNLTSDPALLSELDRLTLTRHAERLIEYSTIECPLCGAPWPEGYLANHIESKIATGQAAEVVRNSITEATEGLSTPTRNLVANIEALSENLKASNLEISEEDVQVLAQWQERLNRLSTALHSPVPGYLDSSFSATDVAGMLVPENLEELLGRIEKTVQDNLPRQSIGQIAWDTLTRLEESVRALENRVYEKELASLHAARSGVLLAEYESSRDSVLEELYSQISDRFVEFYCVLHDHERNHFGAQLQPQGASLTLEVDFLGRGNHPPHALHSEGHQDSMGVCLFLALNEQLAKDKLALIVLDDVMMSVDTEHRRDVCRLLQEQFPDRQFIITTHDKTWAKQLKQEGVVEASRVTEFTGWTVEGGPSTHRQMDFWEGIQADLEKDDVASASFKLRRGSEEYFENVCDALGAQVPYNSRMQWQLDDWLPAAMDEYKSLLQRGRRAASSWGNQVAMDELTELESVRTQVYARTFVEQWAINAAVHFNNWENMSRHDFVPVVDAFRDLHALFECSNCGKLLEKLPRKGPLQSVKCPCGATNFNLRHKS